MEQVTRTQAPFDYCHHDVGRKEREPRHARKMAAPPRIGRAMVLEITPCRAAGSQQLDQPSS